MEFFMPMIPPTITAQQHRIAVVRGKPRVYDPPELAAAKDKLTAALCQHRPAAPLIGALRLTAKWCFTRGRHRDGTYKITRPDTDNLQKALKDCMTRCGFWMDDAQVASEIAEKFWSEVPGIWIRLEVL